MTSGEVDLGLLDNHWWTAVRFGVCNAGIEILSPLPWN